MIDTGGKHHVVTIDVNGVRQANFGRKRQFGLFC